jgi:hypothetical protein
MVLAKSLPDVFLWVEFGTVSRKEFEFERFAMFPQEVFHQRSFVIRRPIHDHDHIAVDLIAEVVEKLREGDLIEVNRLHTKAKLTLVGDGAKHLDTPFSPLRGTLRPLTDACPRSMHRALSAQTDFVFEEDGRPFFLARRAIRGISSLSQRFWASRLAFANVTAGH